MGSVNSTPLSQRGYGSLISLGIQDWQQSPVNIPLYSLELQLSSGQVPWLQLSTVGGEDDGSFSSSQIGQHCPSAFTTLVQLAGNSLHSPEVSRHETSPWKQEHFKQGLMVSVNSTPLSQRGYGSLISLGIQDWQQSPVNIPLYSLELQLSSGQVPWLQLSTVGGEDDGSFSSSQVGQHCPSAFTTLVQLAGNSLHSPEVSRHETSPWKQEHFRQGLMGSVNSTPLSQRGYGSLISLGIQDWQQSPVNIPLYSLELQLSSGQVPWLQLSTVGGEDDGSFSSSQIGQHCPSAFTTLVQLAGNSLHSPEVSRHETSPWKQEHFKQGLMVSVNSTPLSQRGYGSLISLGIQDWQQSPVNIPLYSLELQLSSGQVPWLQLSTVGGEDDGSFSSSQIGQHCPSAFTTLVQLAGNSLHSPEVSRHETSPWKQEHFKQGLMGSVNSTPLSQRGYGSLISLGIQDWQQSPVNIPLYSLELQLSSGQVPWLQLSTVGGEDDGSFSSSQIGQHCPSAFTTLVQLAGNSLHSPEVSRHETSPWKQEHFKQGLMESVNSTPLSQRGYGSLISLGIQDWQQSPVNIPLYSLELQLSSGQVPWLQLSTVGGEDDGSFSSSQIGQHCPSAFTTLVQLAGNSLHSPEVSKHETSPWKQEHFRQGLMGSVNSTPLSQRGYGSLISLGIQDWQQSPVNIPLYSLELQLSSGQVPWLQLSTVGGEDDGSFSSSQIGQHCPSAFTTLVQLAGNSLHSPEVSKHETSPWKQEHFRQGLMGSVNSTPLSQRGYGSLISLGIQDWQQSPVNIPLYSLELQLSSGQVPWLQLSTVGGEDDGSFSSSQIGQHCPSAFTTLVQLAGNSLHSPEVSRHETSPWKQEHFKQGLMESVNSTPLSQRGYGSLISLGIQDWQQSPVNIPLYSLELQLSSGQVPWLQLSTVGGEDDGSFSSSQIGQHCPSAFTTLVQLAGNSLHSPEVSKHETSPWKQEHFRQGLMGSVNSTPLSQRGYGSLISLGIQDWQQSPVNIPLYSLELQLSSGQVPWLQLSTVGGEDDGSFSSSQIGQHCPSAFTTLVQLAGNSLHSPEVSRHETSPWKQEHFKQGLMESVNSTPLSQRGYGSLISLGIQDWQQSPVNIPLYSLELQLSSGQVSWLQSNSSGIHSIKGKKKQLSLQ